MGAAKDFVEKEIKAHDVLIFSKSFCPYCRASKNILHQYTDDMTVYELDEMEDGGDIQAYLGEKTGQRTVPSIWIKQQFIGGNSDLQALSAADIKKRIQG
ncbi:hypothetical protein CspeluHIS016_0112080 [Cutaneotrichosporon spelunceum]|uniref:Glutaredoxin domain-containing protein n=1 Tax=Cutaneotrichosporon spelunceum TaxID=1672016 RepID=A0AAD3YA93_9TREE|nr:hypothetical protein CspeluHIS016_0112080 [Cutaneotrichosporon spelunceum]